MATETKARPGVSLDAVRVEDAMHRGVVSCPLETPLTTVAAMMASNRVHCIVALGDPDQGQEPRLWGLVSDLDLVTIAAAEDVGARTAGGSAATEVVTVGPDETLRRAAQLMAEHDVAHLLVVDPETDRPIGVLSTLDVAAALGGVSSGPKRRNGTRVEELMTRLVITVPPDMPLKQVAALLVEHRISGVPVVDGERVVGIVSEGDVVAIEAGPSASPREGLLGWVLGGDAAERTAKLEARTAGQAMSAPAITINAWRSAAAAAALMDAHGVNRLPVLRGDRLVGIVTRADLVRAFARPDAEIAHDVRHEVIAGSFWIPPHALGVEVADGAVTLTGEVETELVAELLPAQVRTVPGVVGVRSLLTARPAARRRSFSRLGPLV
jgi:CBS domain-containing protein